MKNVVPLFLITTVFLTACGNKPNYPVVTTFAGSGVMGSADGRGAEASFTSPMGVATDTAGNVYVADSYNNLIRKITPDGTVTTLAGSGAQGSADGQGKAASFFSPEGLAVDNQGNVFVTDTHNSLIRKISPDGVVTTIAGRRTGSKDSLPKFDNPAGIAVDASGNLYVADWNNDRLCKITPDGKITKLAGTGTVGTKNSMADSASFYLPWGIAVDLAGNVFVADSYNNMIRKISADGVVHTLAGRKEKGKKDGKDTAASFLHPAGIALDKMGNLYVADVGNNKIRKITPGGVVTTLAGSGVRGLLNGRDTTARFCRPFSVAAGKDGSLYIADYQNNVIRKISF